MVSAVASVDQLIPIQGEDDGAHPVHRPEGAWRLLIIDDDNEVHRATRFAIRGVEIEGRPIEVLSAHSATEGEAMMRREADIGQSPRIERSEQAKVPPRLGHTQRPEAGANQQGYDRRAHVVSPCAGRCVARPRQTRNNPVHFRQTVRLRSPDS